MTFSVYKKTVSVIFGAFLFIFSQPIFSGDRECYEFTSENNPFWCTAFGNCTWWAAYKRPDLKTVTKNDPPTWLDAAKNAGYELGYEPKPDAIAVFSSPAHVAYVESKNSDGSFSVSEMDATGEMGSGKLTATYHLYSEHHYTRENAAGKMGSAGGWNLSGFIYSTLIRMAPLHNGRVYWRTKNPQDLSCENAQAWLVEDDDKGMSYEADASVCPKACYSSAKNDNLKWLDFFIKPTYAGLNDCAVTVSGNKQLVEGTITESQNPYPITGGTNSGTLPELIPNNSTVENASKAKVTSLHINESGYCGMQIKNVGAKKAGAFQTRCYISDGAKIDKNPRDEGKEDSSNGLSVGATKTEHEDFVAPEFPGSYNMVFCVDSAQLILELNEGNNCHVEDPFTVWSNPNVVVSGVNIIGGKTALSPGETFSVDATIANAGENIGQTMLIGYYMDGALIGTDRIKRENLKGSVSKVENLSVATAPNTTGTHKLQVCADFDNRIAETNETDNCTTLDITVGTNAAQIIIPIITELLLSDPELIVKIQGNGKVISIPKGINCPGVCSESLSKPVITLVAKPKIGNVFTGWKGACSATRKERTCKLRVINDRTITATFAKQ